MRTCPPDSYTIHHLVPATTLTTYNSIPKAFKVQQIFFSRSKVQPTHAPDTAVDTTYTSNAATLHLHLLLLLLRRSHLHSQSPSTHPSVHNRSVFDHS